ncbi:peptidase C1 [Legionella dresdenensis]|uniref:Peptidase C1 n=1 Tax=Legionella dresdenensis TaxID=450200 RepID=A0ABV8CFB3_9GAMM
MTKITQSLLAVFICSSVYAQDVEVTGTITRTIQVPAQQTNSTLKNKSPQNSTKTISLLKVNVSEKAKQHFINQAKAINSNRMLLKSNAVRYELPEQVQLGMNDVPVLDQGVHGTCVTFAVTAAYDALLNQGDYLSQVCQLQLGNYLQTNGYAPSGWDGSLGRIALNQIDQFGVISKAKQREAGCAGMAEYPVYSAGNSESMTPEEYHQLSEQLDPMTISWSSILDVNELSDETLDTDLVLTKVKQSLVLGDRVTFGVLLYDINRGLAGAEGKYKANNDSWVLTPEIMRDLFWVFSYDNIGAHEMVITGYDDNAEAVDEKGRTYKGLLTLRNSWGSNLGDAGNFYMSYDYFRTLVIESQRIRKE